MPRLLPMHDDPSARHSAAATGVGVSSSCSPRSSSWPSSVAAHRAALAGCGPRSAPTPSASASVSSAPATAEMTPTETPVPDARGRHRRAPTPEATGTAKPCLPSAVRVETVTDADTYAAGQNPQVSIKLTNQGAVDCTLNVGTTTQIFTITSGNDVWWRSTDCQSEPSDMIVTLAAGQTVASAAPLTWDRTRFRLDVRHRQPACRSGGRCSYHVSVEIGGFSADVVEADPALLSRSLRAELEPDRRLSVRMGRYCRFPLRKILISAVFTSRVTGREFFGIPLE